MAEVQGAGWDDGVAEPLVERRGFPRQFVRFEDW